MFPKFFTKDKDGLIGLNLLNPIRPGVFELDGFLIFAHCFFRRGFSRLNTLNEEFLELLQSVNKDTGCDVKIAIDMDLIGLVGSESSEFEYNYWWGPKFNDKLDSIAFGVTRHKNMQYDSVFSNIQFTEYGWYSQDSRHTFECEEISDVSNHTINGEEYFGCRFIHSMLNPDSNMPTHLDGAIRAYSTEKMLARLDTSLDKSGRDTDYTKLWRVDGDLNVTQWKGLITHYFRDNMLVGEYFNGEDENVVERHKEKQVDGHNVELDKFVPTSIAKNDGYGNPNVFQLYRFGTGQLYFTRQLISRSIAYPPSLFDA